MTGWIELGTTTKVTLEEGEPLEGINGVDGVAERRYGLLLHW